MSARSGTRPSVMPHTTPSTTPMMKPRTASSSVTRICSHSDPASVPCCTHACSCDTILLGSPKKNGSTMPARAHSSQPPISTTKMAPGSASTMRRCPPRRCRLRVGWDSTCAAERAAGTGVVTETSVDMFSLLGSGRDGDRRAGSSGVRTLDLIAQRVPDLLVELDEPRVEADLRHLAGARQIDVVDVLDRPRAGRHDDDPVGERDRLLEVV